MAPTLVRLLFTAILGAYYILLLSSFTTTTVVDAHFTYKTQRRLLPAFPLNPADPAPKTKARPTGARLHQFKPCSAKATIPILVNGRSYTSSDETSLYIVTHGASANPEDYFSYLYHIVGSNSILVAPGFYKDNDDVEPKTYYQADTNLVWQSGTNAYNRGDDAIGPKKGASHAIGNHKCSSFDVYDALLDHFAKKKSFPHLKKVYFVGHSGGSGAISRYSQFFHNRHHFQVRFVVANAANQAYFTSARPEKKVCDSGTLWSYQLTKKKSSKKEGGGKGGMNRYTSARFSSASKIFKTWIKRDIVTLIGDLDTNERYPDGTQNCQSQAQGGENRRDRNYAWWTYINILAGRPSRVKNQYGYHQLIESGAKPYKKVKPSSFNHQNCIVEGVGHEPEKMFQSECGLAALSKEKVPSKGKA